jgi:hypothetical protein
MVEKNGARDWSSATGAGDLAIRINAYWQKQGIDAGARPAMVVPAGQSRKEGMPVYGVKSAIVVHAAPRNAGTK